MEPATAGLAQAALINRHFTTPGVNPLDEVEWVLRDAWTADSKYHNPDVLVPATWRQNDLDVTSKLYLSKADPVERKSVRRLIERVWSKITLEAIRHGYVKAPEGWGSSDMPFFIDSSNWDWWWSLMEQDCSAATLYAEGCYLALHQMAAFNSPVWFNVGRPDRIQQVSACYILGVDDNTGSLTETNTRNAFIFKFGSGAGYNLSRIRGSMEELSTGGIASGPLSFRRMYDATNGTFKSGGMTRRAAELVCMDDDHPDALDFIDCKRREEERMRILIEAGVNLGMDEDGERNVAECTSFQNANMSMRLTDAFMRKVVGDDPNPEWELRARTTGEPVGETHDAREIFYDIADAAWHCADPGVQYHDHFNAWHTTPSIDGIPSPIRSTNPCGEYASNDDTSCNLASINVRKYVGSGGVRLLSNTDGPPYRFDTEGFQHTVDVMIMAMDVLVEFSDFPDDSERGGKGKFRYYTTRLRQLGLGLCNLGAALMVQGMPYDSEEGRDWSAAVCALLTGQAYVMSGRLAHRLGAFHYFDENRDAMMGVISKHISALPVGAPIEGTIWNVAASAWMLAQNLGLNDGYRNAQATVMAPTGSISYLMGCDSTGIEPTFSLLTYKTLAGGGQVVLVADCAVDAARTLGGYSEDNLKQMATGDYSCISEEDRPVFHGANEISPVGHILMLGAIQPFVSGGISKTVNMAESSTVDAIADVYRMAWTHGVKNVAIYRNNSKVRQVLSVKPQAVAGREVVAAVEIPHEQWDGAERRSIDDRISAEVDPRRRMPRTRRSITHKIHIRAAAGREHEGYVHVGFYPDGKIGEFFIEGFGKSGSFTLNALGSWATDFSIGIQYGVPFDVLIRKHVWTSDETGGIVVPDPHGEPLVIRTCESVIDYIVRYLASVSGDTELCEEIGVLTAEVKERKAEAFVSSSGTVIATSSEVTNYAVSNGNGHARETVLGPECRDCGKRMHRSGSCWACSCGATTGCG